MARYWEISAYIREKEGFAVDPCWIAQVKEMHGLSAGPAANRRGPQRIHQCPPHRRTAIERALQHFGMIPEANRPVGYDASRIMLLPEMSRPRSALTSELIRAARALLRWEQRHLSEASSVSLRTIKRLEAKPGPLRAHGSTVIAIRGALEQAGIEFMDENNGGSGLCLRRRSRPKT
jgi:hypothetical protein